MSTESRIRRLLGSLALAAVAILFTLALCEVALRVLGYEPIYAVYSSPEIFWRKDDLLGWSHETNVEGTYIGPRPWPVEYEAPIRINALGLRGPEITELPPDGYRVMVLGDSVVAGFEVAEEKTFCALLSAQLTARFGFPVQVINAGVRGYGTDQSFLYYTKRGRHLRPDLVVLIYGGNDYADIVTLHRMRRTFGKGALSPRPDGTFELVGYPIPDYPLCSEWIVDSKFRPNRVDTSFESAMCTIQTQLSDRSALFTLVSMRIRQSPAILRFLYRLGSPSGGAEAVLLGMLGDEAPEKLDVASRYDLNGAILAAFAREMADGKTELMLPRLPGSGPDEFAQALGSDRVVSFELDPDMSAPDYRWRNDSHWNERGHALMAERLGSAIAERIRARRG